MIIFLPSHDRLGVPVKPPGTGERMKAIKVIIYFFEFDIAKVAMFPSVATFLGPPGNPVKPFETAQPIKVAKMAMYFFRTAED